MKNTILSSEARRKLGGTYAPRKPIAGEAPPRQNNLWILRNLSESDIGAAYLRPGSGDAALIPSRGPFKISGSV